MWTRIVAIAVGCFILGATGLRADDKDESQPSFWMQKKLQYSGNVLAGLASGDFDAIAQNARAMSALNTVERWVHASSPEYRAQLKSFSAANEKLIRAAGERDLDGAALAHLQLTMSCVNCHRVLRDSKSTEPRSP